MQEWNTDLVGKNHISTHRRTLRLEVSCLGFFIQKNRILKQHSRAKCEPEKSSKTFDPREIGKLKVNDQIQLDLAVDNN